MFNWRKQDRLRTQYQVHSIHSYATDKNFLQHFGMHSNHIFSEKNKKKKCRLSIWLGFIRIIRIFFNLLVKPQKVQYISYVSYQLMNKLR